MKWFQVDSDTPNDPKIAAVYRQMGLPGLGALFLLWCHIADHGTRRPGWSINSMGKPMPEAELADACKLNADEFTKLVLICTTSGHFSRQPWVKRSVIAIPAMARRADTYTKRNFEAGSKPRQTNFANNTTQDSTDKEEPPTPFQGARLKRAELKEATELRNRVYGGCPHEPKCGKTKKCVEAIALSRRAS